MVKKRQKKAKKSGKRAFDTRALVALGLVLIAGIFFFAMGGKEKSQEAVNPATPPPDTREHLILGLYPVINKASIHEPGKVKIMEFLSFYCGHCYQFNGIKPALENKYGSKLKIEPMPIVWGKQSIKSVEAYIIAEQLGKGSQMRDALFRANFEGGMDIGSEDVLIEIAGDIDLGNEFASKLKSGEAESRGKENLRLAGTYGVEETPTLIIDGNIKVTPHETGDDVAKMAENLDEIIGEILKQ